MTQTSDAMQPFQVHVQLCDDLYYLRLGVFPSVPNCFVELFTLKL
jgi:hypothetical protein